MLENTIINFYDPIKFQIQPPSYKNKRRPKGKEKNFVQTLKSQAKHDFHREQQCPAI